MFHYHCRTSLRSNEQPYSHLDFFFGRLAQHHFSPVVRRQQLDAVNDSHRTLCPSSSSCCSFPSSSASLVIRDLGHRCRLSLRTCNTVLFVLITSTTVLTLHCSIRCSALLQSAHTSHVRCFPNVPNSSSRVLKHHRRLKPLRNQIVVGRRSRIFLFAFTRRHCFFAAVGPIAQCGSV